MKVNKSTDQAAFAGICFSGWSREGYWQDGKLLNKWEVRLERNVPITKLYDIPQFARLPGKRGGKPDLVSP